MKLQKRRIGALHATLRELGLKPGNVKQVLVEHHLAHASSAFHFSGFPSAAIMTIDGYGELTSTLLAEGHADGKIEKHKEIFKPDSLGLFYSTVTEFLGFQANNGEYKVMGMAPYGDPAKCDLGGMVRLTDDGFRCDDERVWVARKKRVVRRKHYSQLLLDQLGPVREGDGLSEPYIHVAAAAQKLLEDIVLGLVDAHLGDVLDRNGGRLAFAGGVALNVRLNRKLIQHPKVKELWVQPASSDAGIGLGAASYAAVSAGETIVPLRSAALGPSFSKAQVRATLDQLNIPYTELGDPPRKAAELLAAGEIVSWFEGRMEFGPRALGQRSILGNPGVKGTRRRDQRAHQVPRELASLLPLGARRARGRPVRLRSPLALHDVHVRGEARVGREGARDRPRRRHRAPRSSSARSTRPASTSCSPTSVS